MATAETPTRGLCNVLFISSSNDPSVATFIKRIEDADQRLRCSFLKLTVADLQLFAPRDEEFDAVVLLHSISQGRNSITDVADARYDKLLPQLRNKYGPHRVAVVVHSMMSFNPDTKTALMMVFKKSQPTTFKCSNCVIQCGNPSAMPQDDCSHLVEFLVKAPSHERPSATSCISTSPESPEKVIKHLSESHCHDQQSFTDKKYMVTPKSPQKVDDGTSLGKFKVTSSENTSNIPSQIRDPLSTSSKSSGASMCAHSPHMNTQDFTKELGPSSYSTQTKTTARPEPLEGDGSIIDPLSVISSPDNPEPLKGQCTFQHSMTSSKGETSDVASTLEHSSSLHGHPSSASHSNFTPHSSSAHSSPVYQSPKPKIDTTFPIAFIVPRSKDHKAMQVAMEHLFPGKTIIPAKNIEYLNRNWHMFEAIFIDMDLPKYYKKMRHVINDTLNECKMHSRVSENVAVLMKETQTHPEDLQQLLRRHAPRVFHYCETDNITVFDDVTTDKIQEWMQECNSRFLDAVSRQSERNVIKKAIQGIIDFML